MNDSEVTSLRRLPDVILALKSSKVSGVVIERPVAEAYSKQNPELDFANVKFNEEKKPTCIAVPKNSPILLDKLNQTID
nr:transporter substrate-binding domain-containing protein [Staphylococcus saccharolyticus]